MWVEIAVWISFRIWFTSPEDKCFVFKLKRCQDCWLFLISSCQKTTIRKIPSGFITSFHPSHIHPKTQTGLLNKGSERMKSHKKDRKIHQSCVSGLCYDLNWAVNWVWIKTHSCSPKSPHRTHPVTLHSFVISVSDAHQFKRFCKWWNSQFVMKLLNYKTVKNTLFKSVMSSPLTLTETLSSRSPSELSFTARPDVTYTETRDGSLSGFTQSETQTKQSYLFKWQSSKFMGNSRHSLNRIKTLFVSHHYCTFQRV